MGFESLPRSLRNPLQTAGFALVLVVLGSGEGNVEGNTPLGWLSLLWASLPGDSDNTLDALLQLPPAARSTRQASYPRRAADLPQL